MKTILLFIACYTTIVATPLQPEQIQFKSYPLTETQKKEIILKESDYEKKLREPIPRQNLDRYTQDEIKTLIRQEVERQGGSVQDVATALAISECESGNNYLAKNPNSSSKGVYQILDSTAVAWGVVDVYSPVDNCRGAIKQIVKGNLKPWKASENCWKNKI